MADMADADIKAEMKKAILELQSLGVELNEAVEQPAANIESKDGNIGQGLRDIYDRVSARSEEILAQLDRLQDGLKIKP